MNCNKVREEIGDLLLREELSAEEIEGLPETVRHHAENCSGCGRLLETLRSIARGAYTDPEPSADLAKRIVSSLSLDKEEPRMGESRPDVWRPRRGVRRGKSFGLLSGIPTWIRASVGAVVLVLLSVMVTTLVLSPFQGEPEVIVVRLELRAPDAEAVSVVGDWNGWDPNQHPMNDADRDGVWQVEFEVVRDREYQYQFLINRERWIADPDAPITVDDGFGGQNSILNI